MTIARARLIPFRLVLRTPLETHHGQLEARDGVWLGLDREGGEVTGWGEASPLPGFGLEPLEECEAELSARLPALLGLAPDEARARLEADPGLGPAARAALDAALLDLEARIAGASLAQYLARGSSAPQRPAEPVPVNALLGGATPAELRASVDAALAAGFDTLKLKVGARSPEQDLSRVRAVRAHAGPEVRLRVDANGAWSEAQAHALLAELAPLELEFVEQPLVRDALPALARLRAESGVAIALDEGLRDLADLERIVAAKAADVAVIKPAAVGGLTRGRALAEAARRAGLRVVFTSFLDSPVGVAGALHLAAAQPPGPACGLATGAHFAAPSRLLDAPAAGRLRVPDAPGLGFTPTLAACGAEARGEVREFAP